MIPTRMNLCLSNRCAARCIFCPTQRGRPGQPEDMSVAVAVHCIDEARRNGIECFSVGENGDALLNAGFLPVLRYLRLTIPKARVVLFSNFALMTPEVIDMLIAHRLVDEFHVNIDGIETYSMVKHLPYGPMADHLKYFLKARGSRPIPLHILVLSFARYATYIHKLFGTLPKSLDMPLVEDETGAVVAEWQPRLKIGQDSICMSPAMGWAHRDLCFGDLTRFACPNLHRFDQECFIAPNGDWYLCCRMAGQEIVVGNLMETPLDELAESPRRADRIAALRERRYSEVGYPCTTVQACQDVFI